MPDKTDEVVTALMAKVKEAAKSGTSEAIDEWVTTLRMYLDAKIAADSLGFELG